MKLAVVLFSILAAFLVVQDQAEAQLLDILTSNLRNPFDDCARAKDNFKNGDVCAMLFDDEGCEGWSLNVPQGYTALRFRNRNDAESLMVKAGCVLVGYDHDSPDVGGRGLAATFDARTRKGDDHMVVKDLDDDQLEEEISAVDCRC